MCAHALHIRYRDQRRRRLLSFSSPGSKARPSVALSMGNHGTAVPTAIERWRDNNVPYCTHHCSIAHWRSLFGHFTHFTSVSVPLPADATGRVFWVSLEKRKFFPVIISRFPFLFRVGVKVQGLQLSKTPREKRGRNAIQPDTSGLKELKN